MELVTRIQHIVRGIRWSLIDRPRDSSWPRMRMKVLHRDRYRCRHCGSPGDEITLQVCLIQVDGQRAGEAVTLCARCQTRCDAARAYPDAFSTPWRSIT